MEPHTEDERGRFEPEIEHLEGDGTEAANIDDEEVEELHKSLKEAVQDPSVKPRLQCLMVDPSFSMVTVQSEDSGIVWETASSRCSTPWASEASSPSDAYSVEGSGTQGNIVIIMDEDKIKRRKKNSSRGKLGDRFRRRLSGAAIGEERPAMTEVSVPNVRQERSDDGQSAESKPDKDQELFNLVSEGFEILNIVVPKLPTLDEEDSTELADNLSYLEDTPKIRSKCRQIENIDIVATSEVEAIDIQETKEEGQKESADEQPQKNETDLDYLEKFTLLDETVPGDDVEKIEPVQSEERQVPQEKEKVDDKVDEDSFVIIGDVEIADEHLDEVFYGASCHEEPKRPSYLKEHEHIERESSKTLKECGSTLFGSQESILIPIYLPSGPPKIVDQDLLDEPRAMSFHYSDLYEDAIGDRKKDDDFSDVESVVSEKSFKRRFSDSDEGDGYLEKFILKDDHPVAEGVAEVDHTESDRTIWSQSKFEMTGCLIRVKEENVPQEEDASVSQPNVEGLKEAIKDQVQHLDSSEDCDELKTVCVTAKSTEEDLGDCEGHCGTETGCVAKIISPDQLSQKGAEVPNKVSQENEKVLLTEHREQSKAEVEHGRSHIHGGRVQGTKVKDELEIIPTPQRHEKPTSNVTKEKAFQDDLTTSQDTVEIEETIIITKKEVSGKEQQYISPQEKAEPDLLVEEGVEDAFVLTEEVVHQKELPEDRKASKKLETEKNVDVETKPSPGNVLEAESEKTIIITKKEVSGKEQQYISPQEKAEPDLLVKKVVEDAFVLTQEVVHQKELHEDKKASMKLEPEKNVDVETKPSTGNVLEAEFEKTIIITKKEVSGKEQPYISPQEKAEPDLLVDEGVEEVFALTQEVVHQKELPEDKKASKKLEPQKNVDVETKPSTRNVLEAESEKTIKITKKEVSGKEQPYISPQDKAEPDLLVEEGVEEAFVLTQEEVHLPEDKKASQKLKPEKNVDVETKPSTVLEAESEKMTESLLAPTSEIQETRQKPAPVQEEVRAEIETQDHEMDKTVVQELDDHVMTKSEAKDEVESNLEQKATEELLICGTDATEKKREDIEVEVAEKTIAENKSVEDMEDTAGESVSVEKKEVCLSDITQYSFPAEEHALVEELGKLEKDVELEHELPSGDEDKTTDKMSEKREVEGDTVLAHTLPTEIPIALPIVPEVPKRDLLMAIEVTPVQDREKHEFAKVADPETKREPAEVVPLISTVETEDSSKESLPNEVVEKQEDQEMRDEVIDLPLKEFTEQGPDPETIHPAAAIIEDASEMPTEEVEGKSETKSKKVLLKDTHKENIWKTLEPTTPPPPVEMKDPPTIRVSPLELPEYIAEEFVADEKRDTGLFSTLRSFSPHEDLSGFGQDIAELDLNRETLEELDYEVVTEQDARESESEVIAGEKEHGCVQDKPAEPTFEASYEFIEDLDGAQTSELGHLIDEVEIQPMDAFCLVCRCPLVMSDGGHQDHEVSTLEKAFDDIKNQLSNWISVLQERSENIEDMVSELELAYNSVEEHCKDSEKAMDEQNEEVLKHVMDQYNEMSQNMEDEKKVKLEQLYDQIVSFQANIDSAKETMEKTTKEMEEADDLTFVISYKDIDTRLKTALESTMSLELGPRGLLVFEDYAKGSTGNEKKNRQVIPVPQQPHLQPQEANSATSTSVTVYWTINEGDIIDCFQVYCMEEPQGAISEEYRVTVKESYCNLEELEPDKCYKVWVMAVNYTGCSLPSERLPFRTAPSIPVIHPDSCTVLWDSATLRWSSAQPSAVDSFTLEYCRQYAMEGEGLRSVSGIKGYEHKVLLQPNENFLFYIKSVNAAGASEQSEAALISTRGTRFHLLSETANPVLKVSQDRNTVEYPQETNNEMFSLTECPAVMGELLPRVGCHYWETLVAGCKAYRIGVAYQKSPKDSTVGDNSDSWCLHCVPTSIRFELLHDNVESDIFVMDVPARIGTLLDFTQGRLSFFNAHNGQCLGSFQQPFTQPCHPVFVLERAGNLELKMTMEVPEFAKHW